MRQVGSLLWKEWREAQVYLWIGLGLFLGLPVIGGIEHRWHRARRFEIEATPWVVTLGGVLAVFVAAGVTTRDLRPGLADFWRSRPVAVGRWMAVKFAVALGVVLVACFLPMGVEMALDREPDATAALLTFYPIYLTAIFALAFLAGSVVDRPAHAATVGLAAMLLVYAVPFVVPPLRWMNVLDYTEGTYEPSTGGRLHEWLRLWGPRQVGFACGMLGLTVVAAVLAAFAVARQWRVESGRRTMYGLVAAAFLLLFASAAFQLATNLPVLQRVDLPADERIDAVIPDGADGGHVLTTTWVHGRQGLPPGYYDDTQRERDWSRALRVSAGGVEVGPPVAIDSLEHNEQIWQYIDHRTHGRFYYWTAGNDVGPKDTIQHYELQVIARDGTGRALFTLPLWDQGVRSPDPFVYVWRDTLYVFGERLQTYSLDPADDRPRRTSDLPVRLRRPGRIVAKDRRLTVELLPLPAMPADERLKATLCLIYPDAHNGPAFDGRLLCKWGDDAEPYAKQGVPLVAYRLISLDDATATFEKIGEYRPTMLQRWVSGFQYGRLTLGGDRVYVDGLGRWSGTFTAGVTILDTAGPRPMVPVGHFAAPGADRIAPLPDGRAVVSGDNHIWLVGRPAASGN